MNLSIQSKNSSYNVVNNQIFTLKIKQNMNPNQGIHLIKLKQENFRIKIRRESIENMFKQKRLIILQSNLSSPEINSDQNDLVTLIPKNLIENFLKSDINAFIMNVDSLSNIIRRFAYKAKVYREERDTSNYKQIEDIIETFYIGNQKVVQILLELCELKCIPTEQDQQGYIPFNQGSFFIEPHLYHLCQLSFLIMTNITYFSSPKIISNLADREITSKVFKTLLNKLDKRQFIQNYDKCCQIIDNMLHFYGNLLIDDNLSEDSQKDMCHDLLCSNISTHMKQMMSKASPVQKLNYQHTQIVFLRTTLGTHVPEDLMQFQFNVIYFIQLSISVISDSNPTISMYAIIVLERLSDQFEGIISVATKCIWETLISKLIDPFVYSHIMGIFGNLVALNGDDITLELINIGFLQVLTDTLEIQELSLHNLKQTLSQLQQIIQKNNQSNELVDIFCKKIMGQIIQNYAMHLDHEEYLQDHGQHLINILRRLIQNKAMTIVNHVFLIESEILEYLVQTIKTHPSLLLDFIQMMCLYKNQDSLVLMEILMRLQNCNSIGAFNIAFNRLPPLLRNDQASQHMEEYGELIFSWELLYEEKSNLDKINQQIIDQQEEICMD